MYPMQKRVQVDGKVQQPVHEDQCAVQINQWEWVMPELLRGLQTKRVHGRLYFSHPHSELCSADKLGVPILCEPVLSGEQYDL